MILPFHGIPGSVYLQVILMVGLPGSGKTQWALKYAKENPEKRYNVLGAEIVLNQMRVSCWERLAMVFTLEVSRNAYNLFLMELVGSFEGRRIRIPQMGK